jgi:hypothetical protein
MLALPLLLFCAAPAAEPPAPTAPTAVGVVVLHRTNVTEAEASSIVKELQQKVATRGALIGNRFLGVAQVLPAAEKGVDPCSGAQDCARATGTRLGLAVIVGVDLAASRRSLVLHLEAVVVADGSRLVTRDVVAPREKSTARLLSEFDTFAGDVAARLPIAESSSSREPQTVKPASDLPRKTEPEVVATGPRPQPREEVVAVAPRSGTSARRGAAWGFGGGALVVALTSIGLTAAGGVQAGRLSANEDGLVNMPYSEAQRISTRANRYFIAGASTAAAAVALAAVAIALHLTDPTTSTPSEAAPAPSP